MGMGSINAKKHLKVGISVLKNKFWVQLRVRSKKKSKT